jgi:hypothetical protein
MKGRHVHRFAYDCPECLAREALITDLTVLLREMRAVIVGYSKEMPPVDDWAKSIRKAVADIDDVLGTTEPAP